MRERVYRLALAITLGTAGTIAWSYSQFVWNVFQQEGSEYALNLYISIDRLALVLLGLGILASLWGFVPTREDRD